MNTGQCLRAVCLSTCVFVCFSPFTLPAHMNTHTHACTHGIHTCKLEQAQLTSGVALPSSKHSMHRTGDAFLAWSPSRVERRSTEAWSGSQDAGSRQVLRVSGDQVVVVHCCPSSGMQMPPLRTLSKPLYLALKRTRLVPQVVVPKQWYNWPTLVDSS